MERWAVKDGMDDPGGREQFPSSLEVHTMYPPDTLGNLTNVLPRTPELAELSTCQAHGPQRRDEGWVSFVVVVA